MLLVDAVNEYTRMYVGRISKKTWSQVGNGIRDACIELAILGFSKGRVCVFSLSQCIVYCLLLLLLCLGYQVLIAGYEAGVAACNVELEVDYSIFIAQPVAMPSTCRWIS